MGLVYQVGMWYYYFGFLCQKAGNSADAKVALKHTLSGMFSFVSWNRVAWEKRMQIKIVFMGVLINARAMVARLFFEHCIQNTQSPLY